MGNWAPSGLVISSKERFLTGLTSPFFRYCCVCPCDSIRSLTLTHVRIPATEIRYRHSRHFVLELFVVQPVLCFGQSPLSCTKKHIVGFLLKMNSGRDGFGQMFSALPSRS